MRKIMSLKLPPLKALKCFVICAKHPSFTKAAGELNLTQGAVSKQIALLEDYLGLQLFKRGSQSLNLSKAAKIFLKEVEAALKNIEAASAKITKSKSSRKAKEILNINVLPSMSSRWLIPLLQDFRNKFPNYDVVVKTGDGDIDFAKAGCDLAIRVAQQKNKASWQKFQSKKIMGEKLLCVCSPKFKEKHQIKNAKDLLKYNLLGHTYRPQMWQKYLDFLGAKKAQVNHSNSFEHFFMLIEAAKNGLGIGLVPEFLIKQELANKELALCFKDNFKSNYGYFLLQQKQKNVPQKISDFATWIKQIA
jgi:DNA-binding transcriptional LysR family regulator